MHRLTYKSLFENYENWYPKNTGIEFRFPIIKWTFSDQKAPFYRLGTVSAVSDIRDNPAEHSPHHRWYRWYSDIVRHFPDDVWNAKISF